jgi:hypothetical protein
MEQIDETTIGIGFNHAKGVAVMDDEWWRKANNVRMKKFQQLCSIINYYFRLINMSFVNSILIGHSRMWQV